MLLARVSPYLVMCHGSLHEAELALAGCWFNYSLPISSCLMPSTSFSIFFLFFFFFFYQLPFSSSSSSFHVCRSPPPSLDSSILFTGGVGGGRRRRRRVGGVESG